MIFLFFLYIYKQTNINMKTTSTENQLSIEDLLSKYRRYIIKVSSTLTTDNYIQEELIQEANIGIWKAYQRFNEAEGELHSYLISYIRGSMLNYLTDSIRTVKPSAKLIHHINRTEGEELAKTISMDIQVEDGYNISETISMEEEDTSTDDQQELVRALLKKHITQLKDQWQKIVTMRYMEEMNLEEIAVNLNITRQAVATQHDNAIKKLQELFKVEQINQHKFKRVKEQKRPNNK